LKSNNVCRTYDHASLTLTNPFKSPNALGQSRGFDSPVATLTTPYAAFAISSPVYARIMCAHAYPNRVQNGALAKETGRLICAISFHEPYGEAAVRLLKRSLRRKKVAERSVLRAINFLHDEDETSVQHGDRKKM
jgi:hypothetical protein